MLFFVCVFIYLLRYRCAGQVIISKFKLNSFHVHVLTDIVLPSSPFFVHCYQINFLSMLIWAKIKWLIDWLIEDAHPILKMKCEAFCSRCGAMDWVLVLSSKHCEIGAQRVRLRAACPSGTGAWIESHISISDYASRLSQRCEWVTAPSKTARRFADPQVLCSSFLRWF